MSIDLTDRAELLEVIAVLVDAMRRSDPDYTQAHDCEQCTDEDWDTAIEAGEDALEAANAVNHAAVISGTGGAREQRQLEAFIRGLKA